MKRFLIGFILGSVLMIGTTASAKVANYVGRIIEGQFPVKVNGKTIDTPGIVVNGTSYLPTRVIAELAGFDVYFDADLGISLTKKVERVDDETKNHLERNKQLTTRLRDVMREIGEIGTEKLRLEEEINRIQTTHATKDQDTSELEQKVQEYEKRLNELYSEKAELEAQLNAQ